MTSVSLPVIRTTGRALLVGAAPSRARASAVLKEMGFTCVEADEPYGAMVELARRPHAYEAMLLSLQGVYREELHLISTVKCRFPDVEVWLADAESRPAGLAEAVRLGADGLLGDDGLHRIALGDPAHAPEARSPALTAAAARDTRDTEVPPGVTAPADAPGAAPARPRGSRRPPRGRR